MPSPTPNSGNKEKAALDLFTRGAGPQNDACRSCEKANSSYDARQVFSLNFSYQVPFGKNHWYGGWQWSGSATAPVCP